MIRYQAAAVALKLFSTNSMTRSAYRRLGNSLSGRKVTNLGGSYVARGAWLIKNLRSLGLLDGRPLAALEVGTGWMHFYGIVLSLAGVASIDLYDQWDNRQFLRLKRSFKDFGSQIEALGLTSSERRNAERNLIVIQDADNFEQLYSRLGMRYFVEPAADMRSLPRGRYDIVCSLDVLEHVNAAGLPEFIGTISSLLKPGGFSLHQIGLDDHLAHYDRRALPKQLLHYGDRVWALRFANGVQYVNRVSLDAFREMFIASDFEAISTATDQNSSAFVRGKVAPCFGNQSEESLAAVRAFFVHRKVA